MGGKKNRLSCCFLWMMPPFPVGGKKKRLSFFFAKLHLFGVCLQNVDVLFSLTALVSKLCLCYYSTSFRSFFFFFPPFFIDSISSCACYLMLHVKKQQHICCSMYVRVSSQIEHTRFLSTDPFTFFQVV